ncbi:MAG: LysR family transcriptional regulator [Methylocella sp.]
MHQIRYFLAASRTLNFTRAAEECDVAQPSLSRAIRLLEVGLGGSLFGRERDLTHLTEFGQKMLPLLRQCYESAVAAKQLAAFLNNGSVASLTLALSHTISMALLVSPLSELMRVFPGVELRFMRGTVAELGKYLKKGEAILAIAGPLGESWDRLDAWPLFAEGFDVVVNARHRMATWRRAELADLSSERMLMRPYCELADAFSARARDRDIQWAGEHAVVSDADLIQLIEADLGIGILPRSTPCPEKLRRIETDGLDIMRTIHLYAVAGREKGPPTIALMNLLRAKDWAAHIA